MTKNEEQNIAACLRSVEGLDQVFVVDSGSTDRTRAIADDFGASVFQFSWDRKYPKKKQWSLESLPFRNDWVLYIDADERLTPDLLAEISEAVRRPGGNRAFWVSLAYVFLGKTLKHGVIARKVVLLQRGFAQFPEYDDLDIANMWEVEGHYQPVIDGPVGILRTRMVHDDHDSLYHFFDRHNRYSDWEASLRTRGEGVRELARHTTRPWAKRFFERLPFRWAWLFCYAFFLRGGFRDGRAGFHFAMAKTFYYWQIDAKSMEIQLRHAAHESR
ncbi:MAG: glycosyltransferase family 2 protein [Candidatus Limnocylindrales bacterium]